MPDLRGVQFCINFDAERYLCSAGQCFRRIAANHMVKGKVRVRDGCEGWV